MASGNLKEGKAQAFQRWVQENEGLLEKHGPPGWTYRGTYFYVLGFGRYTVASMWESRTYGDFDAWREHEDPEWARLSEESSEFYANDPGEAVLLREVGDTKIMEAEAPEG